VLTAHGACPRARAGGKLWVRYEGGLEAPLDWEPEHGYARCTAAEHIRRDVDERAEVVAKLEEERARAEEAARLAALGFAPAAEEKGGGAKKKKGKKK
jgi:hypothetical protein